MSKEECIFCKIIDGQIPSHKIYENDSLLAFLDIFPLNYGHTVVIPKKHYYNFLDMPEDDMGDFFKDLKKISAIIKKKLNIGLILLDEFFSSKNALSELMLVEFKNKKKNNVDSKVACMLLEEYSRFVDSQ